MHLGGQAVVEGVMMRNNNKIAVAVRKPDKSIKVIKFNYSRFNKLKIPFLRGILILIETLYIGMKALFISAEQQETEKSKVTDFELYATIAFSILLAVSIFIFLPLLLSRLITSDTGIINLLDGIFRIAIFIIYLLLISLSKDIKRVFQYHGAEHKVVYCYEDKKPLTVKNCLPYKTLHPRCGTAFIFIVLIISILFFSFIRFDSFLHKFIARLFLIPIIAGISYEILKLSAKHQKSGIIRLLILPGLALQKITTKRPSKQQIEVAIASAKAVTK